MSDIKLGQLIEGEQQRDAIHVAIAPVTAGEKLSPGDHVGFLPDGRIGELGQPHIGIVDPFLKRSVRPDEKCWLLLYQQTVTGMRHHWAHPAFDVPAKPATPTKQESEAWLRQFIATNDCPEYELVIKAASGGHVPDDEFYGRAYTNDGEYLHFNGRDAHSEIPPEFWDHVENVTGVKIPADKRATSFSCSC